MKAYLNKATQNKLSKKQEKIDTFLNLIKEGEKGPFTKVDGKFYEWLFSLARNGK